MKIRGWVVLGVALVAAGAFGSWWWFSQVRASGSTGRLEATGTLEARRVILAPEFGASVVEVLAEEGEQVTKGDPLVRLDQSWLLAQRDQAEAALQSAQAQLDLLLAGVGPKQIQGAEAQLDQAEAALRAAEANLAAVAAETPPEQVSALYKNLDRARAYYRSMTAVLTSDQVEALQAALNLAESNLAAASVRREELSKSEHNPQFVIALADAAAQDAWDSLSAAGEAYEAAADGERRHYQQIDLARYSLEVAEFNLAAAEARHQGLLSDSRSSADGLEAAKNTHTDAQNLVEATQRAYEALTSGVTHQPFIAAWNEVLRAQQALESIGWSVEASARPVSVEALIEQVATARAIRDQASANLAALRAGPRPEELAVAQAQVAAAQAQMRALDVQMEKTVLHAPWDGLILTRSVEPGQLVAPGSALIEIGELSVLEMTVYLPEDQFGRVSPGESVTLQVDAYPDREFFGIVLRLAQQAEFTPSFIQTRSDRDRLVYATVIQVKNPELTLKPGMIADAYFETAAPQSEGR